MEKVIRLNNVTKLYGRKEVLKPLTLEIKQGMFGILGPNGAGKTTLIRILSTLFLPTAGEITYGEWNWKRPDQVRPLIGYLPQNFSLYEKVRLREALAHLAILKGVQGAAQVDELLERVNLVEHAEKKIGELSGGMVRRLGIAQALLGNPEILIVDEPTAGLDPEERLRFRQLLQNIADSAIVIISTHIVEDIALTCNHIAVLCRGELKGQGSTREIRQAAEGKVWGWRGLEESLPPMWREWNIVNRKQEENYLSLRILSDQQPPGSVPVSPSLEEGYLYIVGMDRS